MIVLLKIKVSIEGKTFYVTQNGEIKLSNNLCKARNKKGITLPAVFSLEQNYPNPFNPTTIIRYQLPQEGYVTLKIYDMLGREVSTLVNEYKNAGEYKINFDASSLSSGVYVYRILVNDFVSTKKMILMK